MVHNFIDKLLSHVVSHQFVGVVLDHAVQMGCDNRAGIHHGVTNRLRVFPLAGLYPDSVKSKCRIFARFAWNFRQHIAGLMAISFSPAITPTPRTEPLITIW